MTQWNASFVNAAAADYRLLSSSVFYAAGAGGGVPGVNFTTLNAALAGTLTTTPPPVVQPPPPSSNVAPVADPGGPYVGTKGTAMTVDGSGSSDADGTVSAYSWTFGDEIVVDAADTSGDNNRRDGDWARVSIPGANKGIALRNPDAGAGKIASAASAPASYVDVRFYAAAGVPYHLWFRMQAEDNSYTNDSMFVQFSGAVNASGAAVNRIGTTAASIVILEEGQGAGVSGWGWNDDGYGTLGAPVYFATSGIQTIRVQQREDGIMWDQLVVSASKYLSKRPGLTRSDTTVVAHPNGTGMVTSHTYPVAGQFPVRLTVTDNDGAASTAGTTAAVK